MSDMAEKIKAKVAAILAAKKAAQAVPSEDGTEVYQLVDPFWGMAGSLTRWLTDEGVLPPSPEATTVACTRSYCLAAPGHACQRASGKPRPPHTERIIAVSLAGWIRTYLRVVNGGPGRGAVPPNLDVL